ncbi:MAG: hypothetical protein SXQ77_08725, partial [Halobacteria archaeon]|nr:hypothetical protein [Halobacteria archaeon]
MPVYDRSEPTEYEEIDRWETGNGSVKGVGWIAHPDEDGRRASHAVLGDYDGNDNDDEAGVWLIDPIDAPGVDDLIGEFDESIEGIAVLSSWHTRDSATFSE